MPSDEDTETTYSLDSAAQSTEVADTFSGPDAFVWNTGAKGSSITWTAPSVSKGTTYTFACTINDNALVPSGDLGSRKDAAVISFATITVEPAPAGYVPGNPGSGSGGGSGGSSGSSGSGTSSNSGNSGGGKSNASGGGSPAGMLQPPLVPYRALGVMST